MESQSNKGEALADKNNNGIRKENIQTDEEVNT
jgi:hypothetical protein